MAEEEEAPKKSFLWRQSQQMMESIDFRREFLAGIDALTSTVEMLEGGQERQTEAVLTAEEQAKIRERRRQENEQKASKKFFGDLGLTLRGQAFQSVRKFDQLFSNFKDILEENAIDMLTGRAAAKKKAGMVQNTFWARMLGQDKFFEVNKREEEEERFTRNQQGHDHQQAMHPGQYPQHQGHTGQPAYTKDGKLLVAKEKEPIMKHVVPLLFALYKLGLRDKTEMILDNIKGNTQETVRTLKSLLTGTMEKYTEDLKERGRGILDSIRDRRYGKDSDAGVRAARDKKTVIRETSSIWSSGIFTLLRGMAGLLGNMGSLGGAVSGAVNSVLKKAAFVARMGGVISVILGSAFDGIVGYFKSDRWGVSGLAGILGGAVAGSGEGLINAFTNMGKWAVAGAVAGSAVPVVGTIAGGLIGAALGAVIGFIGGNKFANWINNDLNMLDGLFGTAMGKAAQDIQTQKEGIEARLSEAMNNEDEVNRLLEAARGDLARAQAAGNTALVNSLTTKVSALEDLSTRMADDTAAAGAELMEIRKKTESEWGVGWTIFKDLVLTPGGYFRNMAGIISSESEARIAEIQSLTEANNEKIADLQRQIVEATQRGDTSIAASLQERVNLLERLNQELDNERLTEAGLYTYISESQIGESLKAFFSKTRSLVETTFVHVGNAFTAVDSTLAEWERGLKDAVRDAWQGFMTFVKDSVTKMFTWDYWFGDKPSRHPTGSAFETNGVPVGGQDQQSRNVRTEDMVRANNPEIREDRPADDISAANFDDAEIARLLRQRFSGGRFGGNAVIDSSQRTTVHNHMVVPLSPYNSDVSVAR